LDSSIFHFDEKRYTKGETLSFESQSTVLLLAVSGEATIINDNLKYVLESSQCGLYQPLERLEIIFRTETFTKILTCPAASTSATISKYCSSDKGPPLTAPNVVASLLRIWAELDPPTSEAGVRLRDAIGQAALDAYLDHRTQDNFSKIPNLIRKSKHYIEQHLADECDLTSLARFAGMSKTHYVSAFRKHYGVTPIRFLWRARTRRAIHLIENTNLNLAEISDQCGYKSQYHLSREVKRATGISPRAIRNACGVSPSGGNRLRHVGAFR
jgi:AraC-like DNA-binding protein